MGRKQRRKAETEHPAPTPSGKGRGRAVALVVVVCAAVALAVMSWQGRSDTTGPDTPSRVQAPPASPVRPPETAAEATGSAPADYRSLLGEWVRPDGGYVLAVTGIDDAGKASVTYLNPRPIHVERAEARLEDGVVGLFVELRDTGYPGSTYTLAYNPQADQLQGIYFQATQRASYDVVFVRR